MNFPTPFKKQKLFLDEIRRYMNPDFLKNSTAAAIIFYILTF